MATRYTQSVGSQSTTVVLQPKKGDKIVFEASKKDIKSMLDKFSVIDQLLSWDYC